MKLLKCLGSYIITFLAYFLLCAFVITVSFLLFFWNFGEIDEARLHFTAIVTFCNVLFITLLFTVGDIIRRRFTVDRPVKEIQEVLDRLTNGDYSARVSESFIAGKYSKFGDIAESINDLAAELSGVETLRADFISNVSHELKTPLAVMQNYGTMLQQPGLPEEKRMEYAKSVSDACRRLAHLITNILKLNKLENQQIFPTVAEYDLSEQVVECLLQFENTWEKKNIDIETDIPDGVRIRADAELLTLVWNNLLSNAFKFTGEGGTVGVYLSTDEKYAIVKVSDTGCGMKPEVGAHIFDKFYQGDTSHATQGNGLGLALVKRVVGIMQGEIGVESVYGQGSTFTVKIRRC
ncbi:HAMP domain-containing sensor histidine kinase [Bianquea renquensis]|jgi:sensor histidine kinase/response regulator|uniref:histidine kinase n=1 Tax=Bianquea renquensis TaxID=2763661 RepID=A0A926I2R0_9FIRM|nr:HAMP domain-containing sensor histidine kinase [Bianquea renquensis]MBC8544341.1 HAMP domain-containing histidine kinase [Bianquea renquensis]